tara:strand:+ start:1139 stop:1378 length:240 start_codon:yes stop_codon:yes gene_type:complete
VPFNTGIDHYVLDVVVALSDSGDDTILEATVTMTIRSKEITLPALHEIVEVVEQHFESNYEFDKATIIGFNFQAVVITQ